MVIGSACLLIPYLNTDTGRLKHDSAGFARGSGFGDIFDNFSGGGSGVFQLGKSRLGVSYNYPTIS